MDYLPYELLFDILSRVPAVDIHENARVVCRRWKRVIHGDAFTQAHLHRTDARLVCRRWKRVIHGDAFTQAHLHRTGYGLLISTKRRSPRMVMAAIQGGGVEVSELRTLPESMDMVKACCNGLVLVISGSYAPDCVTFVVNPSTKCCFKLPMFRCNRTLCYFGIAYAAASMKYKVVATYRSKRNSMLVRCKILTLGVDNTWRRVPTKQLSPKANELLCANPLATGYPVYCDPLITEGHMHWAPWLLENDVLTLNIETEVFVETLVPLAPLEYQIYGPVYNYRSTGSHLSVLICCGYLLWKVWEMRGGSGEWRNVLPDIDLNAHKSEILQLGMEDNDKLWPIGWVKYPEALLFSFYNPTLYDFKTSSRGIIYNLDGDEISSIMLPEPFECCEAVVHKNSLAWC